MFAISVELLHGTFRGDPDGTANTGNLAAAEWPPAPSRLYSAFVAADGTGERCRLTDGVELEWFEALPPPVIHVDPDPPQTELQPRYVVEHKGGAVKHTHQEYVGRSGKLVRAGRRVAPRNPWFGYSWESEAPGERTLRALRLRAARIGYLGASDSPVRVRVLDDRLPPNLPETTLAPDPDGDRWINVPKRGDLRILDRMFDAWTEHGADIARSQFPALRHEVAYSGPESSEAAEIGQMVASLLLRPALPGRRVSTATALFKEAVLSQHQRIFGDPPPILHGHGFTEQGYEIARFLALPDAGHAYSRGRIHGLALWTPPGTEESMNRRIGEAAYSIRRLYGSGVDVEVTPRRSDPRPPRAARRQRWLGPSLSWVTVFPAVHERRRRLDLEEVSRWCRHAGLPAPVGFRSSRRPLVPGAVDLAPVEVNRPGQPGLPYCHVELHFDEPVVGPVVIGSGRQRGLGLCAPARKEGGSPE